jgi:hypothetical protein
MKAGEFLKQKHIYSKKSNGLFISPFSLSIDDMEHLILINFEKDPDEFYNILELQQARDKNGKRSYLIIAYRTDGSTDVYHQFSFPFGSQSSILNDVSFFERPLENAKFEISADQLDVFFEFEDKTHREIKVKVKESNRLKKKPFFLLAPIGVVPLKPTTLPVYSLYEMSFVKQKYAVIEIEIDKVKHEPDTFPLPIDSAKNYFTRYSAETFNVDLNKNFNGPLMPLKPGKNNRIENEGISYELIDNDGHFEIKGMSSKNKKHQININFFPPVPDILCLKDEGYVEGNFIIITDKSPGNIRGNYHIHKSKNEIDLQIEPNKGWKPNEGRWILKILFLVIKVFKEWPKSYVWHAKIKLDETKLPIMESSWKRNSELQQ